MANPEVKDLSLGLWIGAVGIGLSTACLMMRIYTKTAVTKSMSIDDLLATLSWLFAVGVQSIVICECARPLSLPNRVQLANVY